MSHITKLRIRTDGGELAALTKFDNKIEIRGAVCCLKMKMIVVIVMIVVSVQVDHNL
jgi:hypothetical protein